MLLCARHYPVNGSICPHWYHLQWSFPSVCTAISVDFPSYLSRLVLSRSPVIYSHTVTQSYKLYIHTFMHTHHIHNIIHAWLHFSMSKACHLESCLAISLQFGPNSSCAKRIACNYLLSLSKVSFLVFRITICHSSCVKRIAFKYLFKCHPDMLDHEMPLIMFQANNLQIPQKCHPRHVGSRDVTHHVPSE